MVVSFHRLSFVRLLHVPRLAASLACNAASGSRNRSFVLEAAGGAQAGTSKSASPLSVFACLARVSADAPRTPPWWAFALHTAVPPTVTKLV